MNSDSAVAIDGVARGATLPRRSRWVNLRKGFKSFKQFKSFNPLLHLPPRRRGKRAARDGLNGAERLNGLNVLNQHSPGSTLRLRTRLFNCEIWAELARQWSHDHECGT
jgi:hypothetical protein